MNYSIKAFIDEQVERDTKRIKNKRKDNIKQNKRERYQRTMQRTVIQNYIYEHIWILSFPIIVAISLWGIDISEKQMSDATGSAEFVVGFGGMVLFSLFVIFSMAMLIVFVPIVIENTVIFFKNRTYINAMGKNPKRMTSNLFKSQDKVNQEAEKLTINPLNMYVVNEDEKIAYRLYEFIDLNNSTVDRFNFVVPNHLIIKHKDFEPNEAYKIISNKMNFEAIGEFIYRSYNDIKAIEHARYKTAVKDLPTHQQDTQTAILVNETNK